MKQSEEQTKTYQIRYNTQSTDDSNRWRLIADGEETLVSNIIINTQTKPMGEVMRRIDFLYLAQKHS